MADTTAQMNMLRADARELAGMKGHSMGPEEEFMGGAVFISQCTRPGCVRHTWCEIYPDGHDMRGPALTTDCGK